MYKKGKACSNEKETVLVIKKIKTKNSMNIERYPLAQANAFMSHYCKTIGIEREMEERLACSKENEGPGQDKRTRDKIWRRRRRRKTFVENE